MKNLLLFVFVSILFTNCVSVIPLQQKVEFDNPVKGEVLVDGEKAEFKDGKLLLERDLIPKQITIKRDGYLDQNLAVMQYKGFPWKYLRGFLFWGGVTAVINFDSKSTEAAVGLGVLVGTGLLSLGSKAKEVHYGDIDVPKSSLTKLSLNKELYNDIRLNTVNVDIDKENIEYNYYSKYKHFIKGKKKKVENITEGFKNIKVKNSDFTYYLNDMLEEKGYSDTTQVLFKNNYKNSLLLDAEITGYNVLDVHLKDWDAGGMVSVELEINWKALSVYKEIIYEETVTANSGQFVVHNYFRLQKPFRLALMDGMEKSLMKYLSSNKLNEALENHSLEDDSSGRDFFTIKPEKKYVSNLNEAISSSVTIKTEDGHGSGFLISSDGKILTNYHVVSSFTEGEIEVVLNNGDVKKVKLLQSSKSGDVALLDIEGDDYLPFKLRDSNEFIVGDEVYAVGTPSLEVLAQSVSKGIISGMRDIPDTDRKLIQTDASINAGNSGGALVDKSGLVYGIVSSKLFGIGVEGVGFAIPINDVLGNLFISRE